MKMKHLAKREDELIKILRGLLPLKPLDTLPSIDTTLKAIVEYSRILQSILRQDEINKTILESLDANEDHKRQQLKEERQMLQIRLDLEIESLRWKILNNAF